MGMIYAFEIISDGMTFYTKCQDNWFRNSSNMEGITSTIWEAVVLVVLMRGIS
jgi:hypothetical protein